MFDVVFREVRNISNEWQFHANDDINVECSSHVLELLRTNLAAAIVYPDRQIHTFDAGFVLQCCIEAWWGLGLKGMDV